MEIVIINGSLLEADADVIVNAANSLGVMGGGVAEAIKKAGGDIVEEEVKNLAPIAVGKAVLTTAGNLKFKGIIHAPTMEIPGIRIPLVSIGKATKAALRLADEHGFSKIALPGMGTGIGGVKKEASAHAMIEAIQDFKAQNLKKIILIDVDEEMVSAWRGAIAGKIER
ncbi:MAG: O-acetyl-ADP-ribose deacetylase [Deltaproteobacteria bacterium RIFCSPLOWO2_12_FULL_43_16]|nr:MAG: O-acetyl-ADP-ribose deacetylase [Deltaproteobacteria bacterium GWA2_43_19]OGQ11916.1 MAG: O-acetyl-ADP-ribose deacetylase [Deltaproteobacteria bacterium RIFCSPHIGHO2_02_FULL_43_33]OGQ44327.1 MAG: O-acetyl-ADP-ribose deacetylase [Deltaproteobacteria bacterium RIFCSPLOWO2_01_FULL_42_9]OGQ61112.1 MAG: O-acetyl-ADP-ribose deacetylase [Deltaproteobacteria bacterium RIFCSPLOWO2_12_FULL_43_16]HBR17900.1 O-acetyl-ADP-ribose deacetylase [Deltaproteobacteria bacterium]